MKRCWSTWASSPRIAHDIGDSVGQELLARSVFSQQAYWALRIESITWLNGGLFNEAYTPRLLQKVVSRTPLGDFLSPLQGSGPTLLLIHGYPFNTWDWAPLWDRLTARFTVVAPDMLGMGFSDKPVAYGYSVHDHADMHEALLVHLGVKSAHILAHDIGDSVGQELLARSVFSQQAYGALRIESITWLNGGLFNEA